MSSLCPNKGDTAPLLIMPLVDYPSSSSSADDDHDGENTGQIVSASPEAPRASLKRKRSSASRDGDDASSRGQNGLPPLPPSFHDLYASSARSSTHDDPSLHGGRIRGMPHVDGHWPSHVYLEWNPSPTETEYLNRLITAVESRLQPGQLHRKLHSLLETDLAAPRPLHISLSRPLILETSQRHSFVESLASRIHKSGAVHYRSSRALDNERPRPTQRINPFVTRLTTLDWAPNESRTRWFFVFRVAKPEGDMLNQLLSRCNAVSRNFNLDQLYVNEQNKGDKWQTARGRNGSKRPAKSESEASAADFTDCFHFSIAWTLEEPSGNVSTEDLRMLEQDNESFRNALEGLRKIEIPFDAVKVKIGNEITSIVLSDTVENRGRGILG